ARGLARSGCRPDGKQARTRADARPCRLDLRVMFTQPGMGDSESRALFVDPVTLAIKGDMVVYGTSGTLPFRTKLDYLHR
ncbi:hypothetical protein, partial [Idiomarina sp. ST10R2A5]|uniref:hypothetical protein n=1 Tax=Idiomarina sp. ST10R2A5 TaxID=3418368 RepID=UPI003EC89ADF